MTTTNKAALADLLDANFEGMVRGLANRLANSPENRSNALITADDLYGEGMLASVKAYESYRPNDQSRAKFRTYAFVFIDRAMKRFCNQNRFTLSSSPTDRRVHFEDVRQANSGLTNIDDVDVGYTPSPQDGIDLEDYFLRGLGEPRRSIAIDRYVNRMTLREIANKHSMSASGVQSVLNRLKHKLICRAKKYESED